MNENSRKNTQKTEENTYFTNTGLEISPKNQSFPSKISSSEAILATDPSESANNQNQSKENAHIDEKAVKNTEKSTSVAEKQENQQESSPAAANGTKSATNEVVSNENNDPVSIFDRFYTESSQEELLNSFPQAKVEELKKNSAFNALLQTIISSPSLLRVYEAYISIAEKAENTERERLYQAIANAQAGVGSLNNNGGKANIFFTKEQVKQMTPEQIKENFVQIRESQQRW